MFVTIQFMFHTRRRQPIIMILKKFAFNAGAQVLWEVKRLMLNVIVVLEQANLSLNHRQLYSIKTLRGQDYERNKI